jgi:hypothetical protein
MQAPSLVHPTLTQFFLAADRTVSLRQARGPGQPAPSALRRGHRRYAPAGWSGVYGAAAARGAAGGGAWDGVHR